MNVTLVGIERLRNLGNYENVKVKLEATVGPDDQPEEVYAHLKSMAEDLLFPELRQEKPAVKLWSDGYRQ